MGFGMVGLAGVLAADDRLGTGLEQPVVLICDWFARSDGARAASFRPESQAGRPPVHERWALAPRHI